MGWTMLAIAFSLYAFNLNAALAWLIVLGYQHQQAQRVQEPSASPGLRVIAGGRQ